MTDSSTMRDLVREERRALIDTLGSLNAEQWQARSLCAGWRVIDVAAHLAWALVVGPVEGGVAMARHGFSLNKMIAGSAIAWSARGRDAILEQLGRNMESGAKPLGMPLVAALADAVVHGLDVRRPLGLSRPVLPDALGAIAGFSLGTPWPLNALVGGSARRRLDGVRLIATDVDWVHGEGAEVRASSDVIALVLYGRPPRADELTGSGAQILSARL